MLSTALSVLQTSRSDEAILPLKNWYARAAMMCRRSLQARPCPMTLRCLRCAACRVPRFGPRPAADNALRHVTRLDALRIRRPTSELADTSILSAICYGPSSPRLRGKMAPGKFRSGENQSSSPCIPALRGKRAETSLRPRPQAVDSVSHLKLVLRVRKRVV
jgi:hypothetical protein